MKKPDPCEPEFVGPFSPKRLRKLALAQFDSEMRELKLMCSADKDVKTLADDLAGMRKPVSMTREIIKDMLVDCTPECCHWRKDVSELLKADNYCQLPSVLVSMLRHILWCVQDDGRLDLLRIRLTYDCSEVQKLYPELAKHFTPEPFFRHFIVTDVTSAGDMEIAKEWARRQNYLFPFPFKVLEAESMPFSGIDQFDRFVRIISDPKNYDPEAGLRPELPEELFLRPWREHMKKLKKT